VIAKIYNENGCCAHESVKKTEIPASLAVALQTKVIDIIHDKYSESMEEAL
jgi:hypothetical protein